MIKVYKAALGNPELRDSQRARMVNEIMRGGILWEHNDLAISNSDAGRAYTLGPSYQNTRNLSGPSVGSKVPLEGQNDHHKLRHNLIKVSVCLVCSV